MKVSCNYDCHSREGLSSNVLVGDGNPSHSVIPAQAGIQLMKIKIFAALSGSRTKPPALPEGAVLFIHFPPTQHAQAEYFVTCDDMLIKKAQKIADIRVSVLSLLEFISRKVFYETGN